MVLRPFEYADALVQFGHVVAGIGWIKPFDWPAWQGRAEEFVARPEEMERASLHDIQRLLTTHWRKERFCDGHLAEMLECGHFESLLGRLAALLEQEERGRQSPASSYRDGEDSWTRIGTLNPHHQLVLGTRGSLGNDHCQSSSWVRCLLCGADYGANGSDLSHRRCPACQDGQPVIPY